MTPHEILDEMYQRKPLIFGHRGASSDAPMNTIPAFELALQQGVDGVELDVQLSKDGEVVVIHDFTVDATTDASGPVASFSLAELRRLDAGSWFEPRFAGTRIPTLDEVFEAVGRDLYINVEIKSITVDSNGLEASVAQCIARHNMQRRVIVSSFNPLSLIEFRKVMADVPLGYLYAPDFPTMPLEMTSQLVYEANHPLHEMIDADYMAVNAALGYRTNTWTVNDPERAIVLRDLGVDMLITDKPSLILDALGR